jgi:hypothetical protein
MIQNNSPLLIITFLCLLIIFDYALADPWDILFYTNAGDTCSDTQLLGCEYANGTFWITGANSGSMPNKVYRLDNEGNYVGEFDQWSTSVWGWRDLTYDGTCLYGSDSYTIHAFDTTGTPMPGMNINAPISPCRALAYDPARDHFWSQTFAGLLYEFGRDGTIYSQGNTGIATPTGMAWDNADPNGPWLWIFDQSGIPPTTIHQYDPYIHVPTGFSYTVPMIPGCTNQNAGGLAFTNEWNPAYWTLVGLAQAEPGDMLFTLEMYSIINPGNLIGRVLEAATSLPLENARVVLANDTTRTDSLGSYQFSNIPIGTYEITASKFGYNSNIDTVEIFPDSTLIKLFYMTQPIISVDVDLIQMWAPPCFPLFGEFEVYNIGDGPLEYNINIAFEINESNMEEPWLAVSPASGTILPAESETIFCDGQVPDTAHYWDIYETDIIIFNNSIVGPVLVHYWEEVWPAAVIRDKITPLNFTLHQNTPNPFNPITNIRFDLPHSSHINLTIYNILGQEVITLIDQEMTSGTHQATFDGSSLSSGIYFYRIQTTSFTDIKKMVLIK